MSSVINHNDMRTEMTMLSFGFTQSRVSTFENTFVLVSETSPHTDMFFICCKQNVTVSSKISAHCICLQNMYNMFFFFLSQSNCAQYAAERRDEEKMCDHLIRAAKYRDHVTATQLIQKIVNILTDKHGAWGSSSKR